MTEFSNVPPDLLLIPSRAPRPEVHPPKPATIDTAADALNHMQELVAFVARDDRDGACRLAERMLGSLALVLQDYDLELAEVLPRKRCVDCKLEVADYRMTPVDAQLVGPRVVVCHPCTIERAAAARTANVSVLELAAKAVAARAPTYGHPKPSFDRVAQMWSAILGRTTTPAEVALCMIALKVARLVETPTHRDSWVDAAGYADIGGQVST